MSGTGSILFVCMGNICRSPLAEGIARHVLASTPAGRGVRLDSAGTHAYHVGKPPDPRAIAVARRHGIDIAGLRAREVQAEDFTRFDLILCADRQNLAALERLRPASAVEPELLLPWCGLAQDEVPDPYYGDAASFERVFALLQQAADRLALRL